MKDARDTDGTLSTDACLTLLANVHRRAVLLSIHDRGVDGGPVPVEEAVPGPIPRSLAVSLNHNHLPKLEDSGVVRWDREGETVAAGPAFDEIEPFIDHLDDGRGRLPDDWRAGSGR